MMTSKKSALFVLLGSIALGGCAAETGEGEELSVSRHALTQAQRETKINAKRTANSFLGSAIGGFTHWSDGARRQYSGGNIYIGDDVNAAHLVYGSIFSKYIAKGGPSFIGYPTTDELDTSESTGRFNHFEWGSVYYKWGAPAAYEVHGCHRVVWARTGWELGKLGFPTTDEFTQSGKQISRFENGNLYFSGGSGGCHYLSWPVLTHHRHAGPPSGPRIDSVTFTQSQSSDYVFVSVSGTGFASGEIVELTFNNPATQNAICNVAAAPNGNINANGCDVLKVAIKKVNGYATAAATGNQGSVAIRAVTTHYGSEYTGAL